MVYKSQRQWGWSSAVEMFCAGAAAGTYLISVISYLIAGRGFYLAGVLASVVLVLVAVILLLTDLSSIWIAPKAFSNLRSPQAKGAIGLTLFTILSVVTAAIAYSGIAAGALPVIAWLGVVTALATLTYPGTIMGSMRAIPFWSGATPTLLVLTGAPLAGAAVVTIMGGLDTVGLNLRMVTLWLLISYGVVLLVHVAMASQGLKAARVSVQQLARGRLAPAFWVGVVLIGVVIPVVLYVVDLWAPRPLVLQVGSVLILAGGVFMRYCLLASGVKIPMLREDAITATYWLGR